MKFRLFITAITTVTVLLACSVRAEKAESFEQAKALSVQTGKPVLLEFNHDDCIHCQQATREFDSIPELIAKLQAVVLYRISVLQGEGTAMAETFRIGTSFPVFILTDSTGNVITRWTGYTGSDRFMTLLDKALADRMTIDQRVIKCQNAPSDADVQFLANYYADSREYVKALSYLRQLQTLQTGVNLYYRVFSLTAEAVWSDMLPFDSLTAAADDMLANPEGTRYYFGEMGQTMAQVARKTGNTNRLAKYLKAGIDATAQAKKSAEIDVNRDLQADFALHSLNDTTEALRIKKLALGDGWETDPARYFRFGEWCFRRGINIDEAERYIRMATDKATEDKFRAAHLRVLAELCYTRGKADEAIKLANESLALDPTAIWFEKKLSDWRAGK